MIEYIFKLLNTTIDTIPLSVSLKLNNKHSETWKNKIDRKKFNIGVAWLGSKAHEDDLQILKKSEKDENSNKFDFAVLGNLNNKNDFIRARAEADSAALKKKFSNNKIYKKNLPNNSSCKSLYAIAEKVRYETLGGKMFKGIKKNFKDNYNQVISFKTKDQLKTKKD